MTVTVDAEITALKQCLQRASRAMASTCATGFRSSPRSAVAVSEATCSPRQRARAPRTLGTRGMASLRPALVSQIGHHEVLPAHADALEDR